MATTPILFNDLLRERGIQPADVRLLRHHTDPGLDGQSLHDLWMRDREGFELYQRTQKANERLLRTGKIWAAFTSPTPGVSLFVGLYDARFEKTAVAEWDCPYRGDRPGRGDPVDLYATKLRPELAEHIGTLAVGWDPASIRSWKRYAANAPFVVESQIDAALPLIETLEDLTRNLMAFERLRSDPGDPERGSYLGFVQRGHCFLPYTTPDGIAFAPSRLLGYKENTLERHAANGGKDGRDSDPAIAGIVGSTYAESAELERAYRAFCGANGLSVHDRKRKYWPVLELSLSPRALPPRARFSVGALYTRGEVAEMIGLQTRRGGNWDTGYAQVDGEFFVFANVGSKGRTGHDYPNRWHGKQLIWSAKTGTRLGQSQIVALLSGEHPVHIFWRAGERERFTYAGLAAPLEVEDTTPVRVRWDLDPGPGRRIGADTSSAHNRRGPPPIAGARTTIYGDGPTSVYLLELDGPIAQLFPTLPEKSRVIKIGISNDPLRRVGDLSCGLPPGCALGWRIVATRLFPTGREAFDVESMLLERLRLNGWSLGGEFAAVSDADLARLTTLA
ncbi:GIY-YIG nuclease family protein [Sphingomonas canadensis]|uniref:GIY-YIG nuclease family protein n=1 Tax=Sphingomonas canadensis TaxID=1219257 RepID=A0ABW3H0R0_9SPHN|nr:GIY-YIG nuclease family protein [Sphingomonas canadensis]MCW3835051.1 GIY-YIG nuclease family protein [Sphingomonas canadensis]